MQIIAPDRVRVRVSHSVPIYLFILSILSIVYPSINLSNLSHIYLVPCEDQDDDDDDDDNGAKRDVL